MRIGIDVRAMFLPKTGDRTYVLNLVKSLMKLDECNQYFLLTRAVPDSLPFPLRANFQIVRVPSRSGWDFTMLRLPLLARRLKLDVLHVQYVTPLLKTCRLLTTIHDVSFKRLPWAFPKKDLVLLNLFIPLSVRVADRVLTVSESSKGDIIQFYRIAPQKVLVTYDAPEERFFRRPSIAACQQVWKKLDITPPYLLYLGVVQPRKNIKRIIEAVALLKQRGALSERLVIAGKMGWGCEDLPALVKRLALKDDVRFLGYVPDGSLPALYHGATAFVYPSLWEGFGIPVVEAMALGVPVITSNVPPLVEVADEAALLVDPHDVEAIADAIQRIAKDAILRQNLRDRGRERAKRFSWEETARKTLQIYEQVASS